jgi:23S rRNA pseudouridine1911/1915/1917 synthase
MNSQSIKQCILFEDKHLLVLNKPAKIAVQNEGKEKNTLLDYAKNYLAEQRNKTTAWLTMVHRLDQSVSGVLIFSKNSKSAARLSEQFRNKQVEKYYLALVEGCVREKKATLTHSLEKNQQRTQVTLFPSEKTKLARLSFETLFASKEKSLLSIVPETGHYHQIRCQLSAIGHPIFGDVKYGSKIQTSQGLIFLYCARMIFSHPNTHEKLDIQAPTPHWATMK